MRLALASAQVDRHLGSRLREGDVHVGETDRLAERRRERAGRDLAALEDRHALPRDPAVVHLQRDELLRRPLLLLAAKRLDPGEVLVERAGPAEAGLDRR